MRRGSMSSDCGRACPVGGVPWPAPSCRASPAVHCVWFCASRHLGCVSRLPCKQPLTQPRAGEVGGEWTESGWLWAPGEACPPQDWAGGHLGTGGLLPNRQQELEQLVL